MVDFEVGIKGGVDPAKVAPDDMKASLIAKIDAYNARHKAVGGSGLMTIEKAAIMTFLHMELYGVPPAQRK